MSEEETKKLENICRLDEDEYLAALAKFADATWSSFREVHGAVRLKEVEAESNSVKEEVSKIKKELSTAKEKFAQVYEENEVGISERSKIKKRLNEARKLNQAYWKVINSNFKSLTLEEMNALILEMDKIRGALKKARNKEANVEMVVNWYRWLSSRLGS